MRNVETTCDCITEHKQMQASLCGTALFTAWAASYVLEQF